MTLSPKPLLRLDFAKSHRVYKNAAGAKVPGVTTVLDLLAKPALISWANNEGLAGRKIDRVSRDAADVGTIAHGLVEAYLTDRELATDNITPEQHAQASQGFGRFLEWWMPLKANLLHSEYPMVSERFQVGGTADIIAIAEPLGRGELILADGKSSKRIYPEYEVQVATYAAMYEEVTGRHVDRAFVVRFGKEVNDVLEVREVVDREKKVAAFAALAEARRKLHLAGVK